MADQPVDIVPCNDTTTTIVTPLPTTFCDSSQGSGSEEQALTSKFSAHSGRDKQLPGWDKPKPYAGRGTSLTTTIRQQLIAWKNQMIVDAKNGAVDAQIDYAMSLWRGNQNYKIDVNREDARSWMYHAAEDSKHDLYSRGGCGPSNCHKCHAKIILKQMDAWFDEEKKRTQYNIPIHIGIYTPNILLNILSYCDPDTLFQLSQVNTYFHTVIQDSRAWSHINMKSYFPLPRLQMGIDLDAPREDWTPENDPGPWSDVVIQPPSPSSLPSNLPTALPPSPDNEPKTPLEVFSELPPLPKLVCVVCRDDIDPHQPHIQASTLPNVYLKHFAACKECFYQRSQGTITPYTLQGVKTLAIQHELTLDAQIQLQWERYARNRIEIINQHEFSLKTLKPPVKPDNYDQTLADVLSFERHNAELLNLEPQYDGDDTDYSYDASDSTDSEYDDSIVSSHNSKQKVNKKSQSYYDEMVRNLDNPRDIIARTDIPLNQPVAVRAPLLDDPSDDDIATTNAYTKHAHNPAYIHATTTHTHHTPIHTTTTTAPTTTCTSNITTTTNDTTPTYNYEDGDESRETLDLRDKQLAISRSKDRDYRQKQLLLRPAPEETQEEMEAQHQRDLIRLQELREFNQLQRQEREQRQLEKQRQQQEQEEKEHQEQEQEQQERERLEQHQRFEQQRRIEQQQQEQQRLFQQEQQRLLQQQQQQQDNDDSSSNDDDYDLLASAFWSGEQVDLITDNDKAKNEQWQTVLNRKQIELDEYWIKKHMIVWYTDALNKYSMISYSLMLKEGLPWTPYHNRLTGIPSDNKDSIQIHNALQSPTIHRPIEDEDDNTNNNNGSNINHIDHIIELQYPTILQGHGHRGIQTSSTSSSSSTSTDQTETETDEQENTITLSGPEFTITDSPDASAPSFIIPAIDLLENQTEQEENMNTPLSFVYNPYFTGIRFTPRQYTFFETIKHHMNDNLRKQLSILYGVYIKNCNPYTNTLISQPDINLKSMKTSSFIVDNTPLWLLILSFQRYRKYATVWSFTNQVVVEYPTRPICVFSHGDSRYIEYSQHQNNVYIENTISNTSTSSQQALPLVYEILSTLLEFTSGMRYLQLRNHIFKSLLPRFNLKLVVQEGILEPDFASMRPNESVHDNDGIGSIYPRGKYQIVYDPNAHAKLKQQYVKNQME